jgi:Uncharacterized conserved protein
MSALAMTLLKADLAVARLSKDETFPQWPLAGEFFSITKTYDELSIVCDEALVPEGVVCERGWKALKVEGPLDFSLIGILARISSALAAAGISIFALSTYETDYILVKKEKIETAIETLFKEGYIINR